jgi:hypothetical protein
MDTKLSTPFVAFDPTPFVAFDPTPFVAFDPFVTFVFN